MGGWMDGQKDGQMDEWLNERMETGYNDGSVIAVDDTVSKYPTEPVIQSVGNGGAG